LIEQPPTTRISRLAAPVRRWLVKSLERRFERELENYRRPPEIKVGRLGGGDQSARRQVFRSLVQVNFYPR
jgi:hypothetical protein